MAHARFDDRGEDLEIDGLGDIIICPETTPLELGIPVRQRRHEYERYGLEFRRQRRQALKHFESGHAGHIDVAQHQVDIHLQDRAIAGMPIQRDGHDVASVAQVLSDQDGCFRIVLDAQYFLGWSDHAAVVQAHFSA